MTSSNRTPPSGQLVAHIFDSGFSHSRDTYNGLSSAGDGNIYYILSSPSLEVGAQMFSYNPLSDRIQHLGDLSEVCGERAKKTIPQGKSHVPFFESRGKLYFATHVDYYSVCEDREILGKPPSGYRPYPGGHFLSYDLASQEFEDLAQAPPEEGIVSMTMDTIRHCLYALTWPSGDFLVYDLHSAKLRNLGAVSGQGEAGRGSAYRTLCRSLVVDPQHGSVYFTDSEGSILKHEYGGDRVDQLQGEDLRKDYFGLYDPATPGHMGYNWRQALWYEPENVIYAVHGNSGYLFRFDPRIPQVEVLQRLTSLPSQRSGMFDRFYYGYLGFTLGPDGHTLFYLTGGPILQEGRLIVTRDSREVGARGPENLHLITFDIPNRTYHDHGPIFFENGERPSYVNSIAVGKDEAVYALSRVAESEDARTDLIRIASLRTNH